MRKLFLALCVTPILFSGTIPVFASGNEVAVGESASGSSQEMEGARDFVKGLSAQTFSIIENAELKDVQKKDSLKDLFRQNVDVNWMARFVMGKHFRKIKSDKTRQHYVSLYGDYLVESYIPKFREFSGEKFNIIKIRKDDEGEYTVFTELVPPTPDAPSTKVDYKIHKKSDAEYKIVDVIGEGVSLITTQRSDFGGMISRKGVKFFIERLEAKVNKMKAAS